MGAELTEHFLTNLADPLERDPGPIEGALAEAIQAAEKAWSGFSVPPMEFVPHLARCLGETEDPARDLAKINVADVYLAFACAKGDPIAVDVFRKHVRSSIKKAIHKAGGSGPALHDIEQDVWERLLVRRRGNLPRIAQFTGRSSIRTWVGVVAARQTIQVLRRRPHYELCEDWVFEAWSSQVDHEENQRLMELYQDAFKQAFEQALASLTRRDRTILRMHLLDGLSVPQIGRLYRVNRSTALRWMTSIRDRLYQLSREYLMVRIDASRFDADSLIKLLRSRLEPSISRILAPTKPDQPKSGSSGG